MKKVMYKITIILLIGIMLISSYFVFRDCKEDKKQEKIFEELIVIANNEGNEKEQIQEDEINLEELYKINSDVVGWIRIKNTNMNYPIMQSTYSPNYYLTRNFYKNYSSNGTPYMAENCDIEKSDNLIIYGHNINGKRVFGELENYKKEKYYNEHSIIQFHTLKEYAEYEIIAVFKTVAYSSKGFDYYNYYNLKDEKEFNIFVNKCMELSFYNTGKKAQYGDRLITLSTCEYSNKNRKISSCSKKSNLGGVK